MLNQCSVSARGSYIGSQKGPMRHVASATPWGLNCDETEELEIIITKNLPVIVPLQLVETATRSRTVEHIVSTPWGLV